MQRTMWVIRVKNLHIMVDNRQIMLYNYCRKVEKSMNISDIEMEMKRVKEVIETTQSPKLKRDYSIHYKRLAKELGRLRREERK